MKFRAIALAMVLAVSLVGMAATPAASTQEAEGEAYSGAHVSFETQGTSVSNYTVNENVVVTNATMQSAGEARNQAGVDLGADLSTVGSIPGAQVESYSEAHASASVEFAGGGEMESHDNQRGVVQFVAADDDQFVQANISEGAETRSESEGRLVVESDDGADGVFIVVGDGEVDSNGDGQVNAEIEQGSELVYRQYDGERSDDDEESERMIEEGTATAELYVQQAGDEGEETNAHAVEYGQDTTVEVTSQNRSNIEMTVDRAESDGKVVLTTVSEEAIDNAEDIEVFVDGEAAARADSYSDVETSATEGDKPRYHVAQSSSAEGAVDVVVGIDHFSERNVQMTTDGDDEPDDNDGTTDGFGSGFGALAALVALATALLAVRRD